MKLPEEADKLRAQLMALECSPGHTFNVAWALALELVLPVLEFYGDMDSYIPSTDEINKARDLLEKTKIVKSCYSIILIQ